MNSLVTGALDTQVPVSDAWINRLGGHLGRQKGVWPDPLIFKQVVGCRERPET